MFSNRVLSTTENNVSENGSCSGHEQLNQRICLEPDCDSYLLRIVEFLVMDTEPYEVVVSV